MANRYLYGIKPKGECFISDTYRIRHGLCNLCHRRMYPPLQQVTSNMQFYTLHFATEMSRAQLCTALRNTEVKHVILGFSLATATAAAAPRSIIASCGAISVSRHTA